MFKKDLTSLKWRKYIYYVSKDGVIFDYTTSKKQDDLDDCGTYLLNLNIAPDIIKNAVNGSIMDISKYPEVFTNNIPYIKLSFINPSGEELTYYYPLQYLIEKGDKVINGILIQNHPDVFDNTYINKFNFDVYEYIKTIIKNKDAFDTKRTDLIIKSLPDWLTGGMDMKYMTKKYIETQFLKGAHYNKSAAIKNATSENDTYQFINAVIGIGTETDDTWVPINIWNEETLNKILKAIDAETIVNKYYNSSKTALNALSVDSMLNIANAIKNVENGFNFNTLKTFLNIEYRDHDCEDVKLESICTTDDINTYYEYLKRKDEIPSLILEDVIEQDKAYITEYIQTHFNNPEDVSKYWWESSITMTNTFTEETDNTIESIVNIFSLGVESEQYNMVIMIYHYGNSVQVSEHPNAFWVSDNNLYERSSQLVKTFQEAYDIMINSEYEKIESRQCVLRASLGPNGASAAPQYIFGNIHQQLFVDAKSGDISQINPAFPEVEPTPIDGNIMILIQNHQESLQQEFPNNVIEFCRYNGDFMTFINDLDFDETKLYSFTSVFRVKNSKQEFRYFNVIQTVTDGIVIEEIKQPIGTELEIPVIDLLSLQYTLFDALDIIKNYAREHLLQLPATEKFKLYTSTDARVPIINYVFGQFVVNATTGQCEYN